MRLVACLIVFWGLSGFADAYRPFTTSQAVSPALAAEAQHFVVEGAMGFEPTRLGLAHFDVFFHPAIAALLENIRVTQAKPRLPDFLGCAFEGRGTFKASSSPDVQDVLARVQSVCQKLHRPELLFAVPTHFKIGVLAMTSIEDVVEAAVSPLEQKGLAFAFSDASTSQKIRGALFRLGYRKFKDELNALLTKLDALPRSLQDPRDVALAVSLRQAGAEQMNTVMIWNNRGKAQYRADAESLRLRGRNRPSLPYDNLSDEDRRLLSTYLYGMMWRYRGGGFVGLGGTQQARFFFAERPFAAIAGLNGSQVSGLGLSMFTRLILKGWGTAFDMGRNKNQDPELDDLVHMTTRGAYQMAGVVSDLATRGYNTVPAEALALQFGVCYLYAWEKLPDLKLEMGLTAPERDYFDQPTAWGELCAGSVFGLGLSETLLEGTAN